MSAAVCIVGAGPAGIVLALELAAAGAEVCVLESGGREVEREAQALAALETTGLPVDPEARLRALGGTTKAWKGRWKPHDPIDFRKRPWLPGSGWPVPYEELEPYYARAGALFGLPGAEGQKPESLPEGEVLRSAALETVVFRFMDPRLWDFGAQLGPRLESASRVRVLLHSTVTELVTDEDARRVLRARTRAAGRGTFDVVADRFVIAAGGIENARLLLLSRSRRPAGLGNDHDQVGRYYMDHPKGRAGRFVPPRRLHLPAYWGSRDGGTAIRAGLRLSDAEQERHGAVNSLVLLHPVYEWSGTPAVESLRRLGGGQPGSGAGRRVRAAGGALRLAARHPRAVGGFLARKVAQRLGRPEAPTSVVLRNYCEQAPDPENRVTLAGARDALGQPRARVHWRITEPDRHGLVALHRVLASELSRLGLGDLETPLLDVGTDPWPVTQDASHPMGTTRMGTDPASSVVDANARVHGTANLYIAGSSVFPTSGYSNPTATILALTLRLAEHLEQRMRHP